MVGAVGELQILRDSRSGFFLGGVQIRITDRDVQNSDGGLGLRFKSPIGVLGHVLEAAMSAGDGRA